MKLFVLLAAGAAFMAAADSAGIDLWKASELKSFEKKLAAKMDAKKTPAAESLANYGNHNVSVIHREVSGEAELHKTQADLFVVQTGEATMVVGGTVVNPRTTAPNEIRGPSIKGGERKQLGPGDILHVPANTPHQLFLDKGKQFTYAIVKVDTP